MSFIVGCVTVKGVEQYSANNSQFFFPGCSAVYRLCALTVKRIPTETYVFVFVLDFSTTAWARAAYDLSPKPAAPLTARLSPQPPVYPA